MFKQYINGELVEGLGAKNSVQDPATGETIATIACATAAQATEALNAAQAAFYRWSKTPITQRIEWLLKLKNACWEQRDKLIDLVMRESGRPYAAAKADFDWCMTSFAYYAEEVKRIYGTSFPAVSSQYGCQYHIVERRALGVVVGHLAWNYPLGNAGLKIGPSVVSGCACIIKPSSETPLATLYIGEIAHKIGFPAGVLNIISGPSSEVAYTLNASVIPKMITLIGSSETGLQIMREAATSVKKYSFELGGNAPVIVMPDVDIDEVAKNIVAKKCGFAGQTCVNYNRIYVHCDIYETLCLALARELRAVKLGKWKDEGNIMGPLINKKARDRVLSLVTDAVSHGAKLLMGGEIPEAFSAGAYMTPVLLKDVTDDMRVSQEEIFGPIIPLQPFNDFDDALRRANNTVYGLSAYFFGHDAREISKAFETMEAGEIFINGCPGTEQTPHAGVKQSGVGCDKSHWSLEEYFDFRYLAMIP